MPENFEKPPASVPENSTSLPPERYDAMLQESLPEDLVSNARAQVEMVYAIRDKNHRENMKNNQPVFYDLVNEPGVYENIRPVQDQLVEGKPMRDVLAWANSADAGPGSQYNRLNAVKAFAFGMFNAANPEHKKESELNPKTLEYAKFASDVFMKLSPELEVSAKPQEHEKQAPAMRRLEYTPDKKTETQEATKPLPRWKVRVEKFGENANENVRIHERKEWLEVLTSPEAGDKVEDLHPAPRDVWNEARHNLLNEHQVKNKEQAMGSRSTESIRTRALDLIQKLGSGDISAVQLQEAIKSTVDARALRMVGLSLLEAGYGGSGQKQFSELPTSAQRLVRLGEVIGMSAEAWMVMSALAVGKISLERAKSAYKLYNRASQSDDLPDAIKSQFADVSKAIRSKFEKKSVSGESKKAAAEKKKAPEVNKEKMKKPEKAPQPEKAKVHTKEAPQRPRESQAWSHENVKYRDSFYEAMKPHISTSGGSEGKFRVHKFLSEDVLGDQLEYAQLVAERNKWVYAIPAWGQIQYLADKAYKFGKHAQLFGWGKALKQFATFSANTEMGKVRARVMNVLDRYKDTTGDKRFAYIETMLAAANRREVPKRALDAESRQIFREDLEDEPAPIETVEIVDEGTSAPQPASAIPDDVIDMVQQTDGNYAPAGYQEKAVETKSDGVFGGKTWWERDERRAEELVENGLSHVVIKEVRDRVILSAGVSNFLDFAMYDSWASAFKQAAESEGKTPEGLWNELLEETGTKPFPARRRDDRDTNQRAA